MTTGSVLISGIGIAGPTLAYWLQRHGFSPTLVEVAPALRTGGYAIDFWGLGYDIAERMGLLPEIDRVGYHVRELRIVDDRGRRIAGFGTRVFDELTGGRFVTLARSDLSRLIFREIQGSAEVLFGDTIVALHDEADGVRVAFETRGRPSLRPGDRRGRSPFERARAGLRARGSFRGASRLHGGCFRGRGLSTARRRGLCGLRPPRPAGRSFRHARRSHDVPVHLRGPRHPAIRPTTSRRRRRSCARDSRAGDGNAIGSSPCSTSPAISISIASVRSGWIAGREDAWCSSATPRSAYPCWQGKARRWR